DDVGPWPGATPWGDHFLGSSPPALPGARGDAGPHGPSSRSPFGEPVPGRSGLPAPRGVESASDGGLPFGPEPSGRRSPGTGMSPHGPWPGDAALGAAPGGGSAGGPSGPGPGDTGGRGVPPARRGEEHAPGAGWPTAQPRSGALPGTGVLPGSGSLAASGALPGGGGGHPRLPEPRQSRPSGRWGDDVGSAPAAGLYRGPETPLAAERARQARIVVVGAVTERWAPEQAGPVHENWQLAPPIGPATDLWALGALLFRAVQGHAPFPEENAAELVQLVCSEPPAYAEECGALRPVVESLLRQDPTERPEVEELRGWLRSLIRSAPEPELGSRTVTVPSLGSGEPGDPRRLPVVRRRGEVVRKRRAGAPAVVHGRHKRGREKRQRGPRTLGRLLLGLILLILVAAVAYAVLFMPPGGEDGSEDRTGAAGSASSAPRPTTGTEDGSTDASEEPSSQEAQSTEPAGLPDGFALRKDPEGFQLAVAQGWERRGKNARGQIRYVGGDHELIVVPGRDSVATYGSDPMAYQQDKERELAAFRDSQWASASGLRRIDVGKTAMAEGAFNWKDSSGREVYARNLAVIVDGRYHLVQVLGPSDAREDVDRFFEQASGTYRATG
ncbi:protein kinase, partial [Streptomyces sp. 8N706]